MLVTRIYFAKNRWTDRDAVWGLTLVGLRNHVLDGSQEWINPFAVTRGDNWQVGDAAICQAAGSHVHCKSGNIWILKWCKIKTLLLQIPNGKWCMAYPLVAWHSGRTSVFGWRTFPVLRSTCSWRVTTYVGKPSAMGQPTRPTQPSVPSGSIDE